MIRLSMSVVKHLGSTGSI